MRSRVRYECFLDRKSRRIFFGYAALGKSGKCYGIGSLPLTFVEAHFHSLCIVSYIFYTDSFDKHCFLSALLKIYCAHFYSSHISKTQFEGIHFQSSVETIFFKMAGMVLIYDFHHNT